MKKRWRRGRPGPRWWLLLFGCLAAQFFYFFLAHIMIIVDSHFAAVWGCRSVQD